MKCSGDQTIALFPENYHSYLPWFFHLAKEFRQRAKCSKNDSKTYQVGNLI
jgi:hypothetical protein